MKSISVDKSLKCQKAKYYYVDMILGLDVHLVVTKE